MSGRRTLMGAMPMIVSAIAGGAKTRVVWGAFETASTDGRVIRMPLLPLEDEHVEAYALGYAVHETGHVVDTDFTVEPGQGLTRALFFILEDARIELNRMRDLPGARRWLENLAYALLRDGRIGAATAEDGMPNVLCSYLLTHVWAEVLQFHGLREAASESRALLLRSLPSDAFAALEAIAFEVADASDTSGVKTIAVRMVQVLQDLADRQPPPQGTANDDDESEQSEEAQGERSVDQPADQAQNRPPEAEPRNDAMPDGGQQQNVPSEPNLDSGQEQGENSDGVPQGTLQQAGSSHPQPDQLQGERPLDGPRDSQDVPGELVPDQMLDDQLTEEPAWEVVATALADLLDADACPQGTDIGEQIAAGLGQALQQAHGRDNAGDGLFTSAPEVFDVTATLGAQQVIRDVRRESLAVRARLAEFLQHQTRARTGNSHSGHRLARNAGLRLASHNYAIYERTKVAGQKVDTAILLLVDMSISMRGHKAEVARRSALALAVALEDIPGVQLAVYSFGGSRGDVLRVVRFGDALRRTAGRFAMMVEGGSTPLAEALMVGHADILAVNAERRILLPATDGMPNNKNAVHQMVRFGERHGIEHIGLGIGADANPGEFFRNSTNIAQVDELPRALVAIAQAHMFRNRRAA